jgi:hypothetical protein
MTLYLSAPGFMASDSGDQLEQARTLALRDSHPTLMALIWHCTDLLLPGPLGLLVLMSGLYWWGLSALFWALDGPVFMRAVGLVGVGFFPPVFSNVPVVWKDTLMQAALVAALACLVVPMRRPILRWLAIALIVVAIGARHNSAAAVWPLLALPILRLGWLSRQPRWRRLALACGLSLALTFALTQALQGALSRISQRDEFWQVIPTFDLAGMSLKANRLLVDPDSGVLTPGMGVDEIRSLYSGEYSNSLYYCLPFGGEDCVSLFRRTKDQVALARLTSNWLRAIRQHPLAYLQHRFDFSSALLAWSGGAKQTYYLATSPHHPLALDYPPPPRTIRMLAWIDAQVPSLPFRPWVYFSICCVLLPVALVRHLRGGPVLPVLYALSGLAYLLSLFVAATSSDYRYSVWMILCAVLGVVTSLPRLRFPGLRSRKTRRVAVF